MLESTPAPEEWRPVVGFEGHYEVSSLGRVVSLKRDRRRVLATGGRHCLYPTVHMSYAGIDKQRTKTVHILVAEAFLGPRPQGMQIRHLDGNRYNSALSNLAYGTPSENLRDMRVHGTNVNSCKTHCPQGHEYTLENTYVWPSAPGRSRACRACRRTES